ncbi:MAG TPA: sugar phosphate nucleotidyltransferase [Candidatus Mcinerneyibacterium sp.]|nr:sugar phosphate nucleotidyltransferase [Candidatus Mcinerneyibacterium sp.]
MKVIIPAAGIGTRLRPHTYNRPKAMVKIAGVPIIGHILNRLEKISPEEILIIVGYKKDTLINWVNKKYQNLNIKFVQQKKMEGLGHAVYMTKESVTNTELLIILGDTIVDIDLKKFTNSKHTTLATKKVKNPKRFGIAELNKKGFIENLIEKPDNPTSNEALIGVYYIKESQPLFNSLKYIIENDIRTKGEYQITDALNRMLKQNNKMKTYNITKWFDCGTIETLLSTNKFLLDKQEDSFIKGKLSNCVINHPVYIDSNVEIKDSIIGPYVSISEKARISNSIIKNSIIYEESFLNNLNIQSSIIGKKSSLNLNSKQINIGDKTSIKGD